ncbi:larval cuticle protein LCP-17 [Cephus cinctus]|uniref:Larval cuticle protein LCP-17 n=1 Tax=Cephus cinctus TaxID=211228 RepID=A0AAJ7BWF8_CEPCN|nr:larval cuticle protein LCP-17 [Cephus cinctus]XP_024940985.1 larval cuticle protein LCP-17 [Cephus cinctus]
MKFVLLAGILATTSAAVAAAGSDKDAPIENQKLEVGLEGEFTNEWSGNGILIKEHGTGKKTDKELAQVIQGSASWTAPDGLAIELKWTADEAGAVLTGSHLPTPPPPQAIPEYISKAIEWSAAHPYDEEAILKKKY